MSNSQAPSSSGYHRNPEIHFSKEGSPLKAGNTLGNLAGTSAYDIPKPHIDFKQIEAPVEDTSTAETEAVGSDVQTPITTIASTEASLDEGAVETCDSKEDSYNGDVSPSATQADINDLWRALQDFQENIEERIRAYNAKSPHKI
jgi:hypothetical protein